ncbi:MAG: DUF5689 domain-containing protein [Muribaculaceae bacterium]
MRQFKLYLNLLLLMAIGMVASCNDDFDRPPMMIPHAAHIDKVNTTILDLKTKYWKEDKNYIDTIKLTEAGDSVVIKGRVVSSDESGNIYKNLVIQDETAAITISINGNSLYNTYRIGQEIVLPVTGLFIGKYNTLQQLGYPDYSDTYGWQATFLPLAMFQEAAELNGLPNAAEIDTISVKMAELPTTPDGIRKMQSQLVRFDGVSFVEADGKTTFSESESSTSRNLKDEDSGNTIIVRNSNYANFKSDILPLGVGSVVGILSYYSGAWQLLLRDVDDCIGFDTTIKGSKAEPYTVAEAIEKQGSEKTAWVSGYIVGAVAPEVTEIKSSADIEFTAPTVLANTLVIADATDVTDVTKCIVLELPQGSQLRSSANLKDHPELLGTKIALKGKFASYMGANGLIGNSGGYNEFVLGDGGGSSEAQGDGTEANPFNALGAKAFASSLASGAESDKDVYIKGRVVSIKENFTTQYGNAAFYIADDMNASSDNQFYIYRCLYFNNEKYSSGDLLKEGDEVVVCGRVTNYMGNTPETVQNKAWLVSINGKTADGGESGGGDQPSGEATGDGTQANPFNSVAAKALAMSLGDNEKSGDVYIKGKVVSIKEQFGTQFGNATFYIADDVNAPSDDQFYIYRCLYLNNEKYTDGTQLAIGDDVVICGKVTKYVSSYGTTPETVQGEAYLVSLTSNGGGSTGGGDNPGGDIGENAIQVVFSALGLENGKDLTTITLSDGTTLSFDKGGNQNGPKYYTNGANVRIYPKNSMKVTSSKKIASIILNCDEYQGVICNASGDISASSGTVNVDGRVVTISEISNNETTITDTSGTTGSASQIRMLSMIINYAE